MVKKLTQIIDLFYIKPLRFIPLNTFRYALVGGLNLALGMVLYWICFQFVVDKENVDFRVVVISPHIMSMFLATGVTLVTGFWLTRNVAFAGSQLRGRTQLFRYAQVVGVNILVNYFGLKLMVEHYDFYPSVSYATIQVVTVIFSYLMQRFYSFSGHDKL